MSKTSTSGRSKSLPANSSVPSRNCIRRRRSSSWLLTFSITAMTMRDANILFSTTSVPTSCNPATSRDSDFFFLGGSRHSCHALVVPSSQSGRHFLYAIQVSRRSWLSRALRGASIRIVSCSCTAAPTSVMALLASVKKRSRTARANCLRGERLEEPVGTVAMTQKVYTVAPAFGSAGSPSFFTGPLIKSSRWMPNHMAIAAATNTDE